MPAFPSRRSIESNAHARRPAVRAAQAALAAAISVFAITSCSSTSTPSTPRGASRDLPAIDLTTKAWFPPIVRQQGNSCAQQAGIYYLLTAEKNRAANRSSWIRSNRLSPYQAYATLADHPNAGTHVTDGWQLARETGAPLETDFPRASRSLMHGFDKYVRAAHHRPASWQILPLRTASDLAAAKDLLAAGHPLACDFQIRGANLVKHPTGRTFVTSWGRSGPGHNMVYAGYDDSVGWDFNHDGQITNDLDLDHDGKITLADRERGAFLVVNPWGPRWGTGGKAWAPYREHALQPWPRAGEVATVQAAPDSAPSSMLRISLSLKERNVLRLTVSDGSRSLNPLPFQAGPWPGTTSNPTSWEVFGKCNLPGPLLSTGPLTNPAGGPLEIGIDLSSLNPRRPITLTFSTSGPPLQGILHAAAIVRLSAEGKVFQETPLPQLPATLPPQGQSWTITP